MRKQATPAQLKWLKDNYHNHTKREMMSHLKITEYMLNRIMADMGLIKPYKRKDRPVKEAPKQVEKVVYTPRAFFEPPKKVMVRPPAEYNNRSQQQVIDYYLNLNVTPNTNHQ